MDTRTAPDGESVPALLGNYRLHAEGTSDAIPAKANRHANRLHQTYKELRNTEAGRSGIVRLMSDESPHVRVWAAAHSLEWATEKAKATLKSLRNSDGPCSFDAKITLEEWGKGTLKFDY